MKNLGLALGINATFSFISGVVLILLHQFAAQLFGSSLTAPFWITGIGLLLFSAWVFYEGSRNPKNLVDVLIVILLDLGWVVGSVLIIIFGLLGLSPTGYIVIGIVGLIVLIFALHQSYALSYADTNKENSIRKRFKFNQPVKADRQTVWEVISDVAGYHEIAPNVDDVNVLSGEGERMVRSCHSGDDSWTETCTAWEPGNKYSFVIDTAAPDYPYPLQFLQGTWGVNALPDKSTEITMTFDFEYQHRYQSLLIHPFMAKWFKNVCRELLQNWEEKIEQRTQ